MKSEVSALMDGTLDEGSQVSQFDHINRDRSLQQAWARYHLIGDALRGSPDLATDITDKVLARLADEPTVLAPVHAAKRRRRLSRYTLALAASVMGIGAVGWVAQTLHSSQGVQVATVSGRVAPQALRPSAAKAAANDTIESVKLSQVRAYLFAHQGYSMESNIQGVAPYVRTVVDAGEGSLR